MRRFVYSPRYDVDIGDHVFPTVKFRLTAELLARGGELVEPPEPSREDLLLAHDAAWVDKVLSGRMTLEDEARMELPFSSAVALAHRLQVGGTALACLWALRGGVGLHVGGGSHHAFRGHGEGFCVLNDLAVAVLKMRREGRIRRAAVVDLDVHQGNGTAAILAGEGDFFTFSMHQQDLYPEVKQRSSLDIGLPKGTSDAEYLVRLAGALPRVFAHRPDLVIYQAGVDGWERDVLGGLKLTERGLLARDALIYAECRRRGVPVAVTLGGGYGQDVRDTARLHARTLLAFTS